MRFSWDAKLKGNNAAKDPRQHSETKMSLKIFLVTATHTQNNILLQCSNIQCCVVSGFFPLSVLLHNGRLRLYPNAFPAFTSQ